jgi:predicted ribosomally synthesized peptide with nif11-like leader
LTAGANKEVFMSQADASSFLDRVAKNAAFRRDVMSPPKDGSEKTPQQLIELGARHGLTFTETELVAAWTEWQKQSKEELSDNELDAVAGGTLSVSEAMASLKLLGEILSNVSKTRSEISMTFARNARA